MKTPLEIPGCLGWLETDSEGVPIDHRRMVTGERTSWIIANKPDDPERGIVLLYDHELTEDESAKLKEYIDAL